MTEGMYWEEVAVRHLKRQGLQILERNFRTRYGEVDIIAQDDDVMVFGEVRYRATQNYGGPLASVTVSKQRKIKVATQIYLKKFKFVPIVRFDVIGITGSKSAPQITWVKGAFE